MIDKISVAPSIQVTFCPFCDYSIYFSLSSESEKNEIICPNCQVKYRVLLLEILRQGFEISKEESPLTHKLSTLTRSGKNYSCQCQSQTHQRKLLSFHGFDTRTIVISQINPVELKSKSGDWIAVFLAIPNRERFQPIPVLVLNCTNKQTLRLLSPMRLSTALSLETKWEIAIVQKDMSIGFVLMMLLGTTVFAISHFWNLPMTTVLMVVLISYSLLVFPFEKIVAFMEHKSFQENDFQTRERLVNEQNLLKSLG